MATGTEQAVESLKGALEATRAEMAALDERRVQLAEEADRIDKALRALATADQEVFYVREKHSNHVGKYKPLFDFLTKSSGKGPLSMKFEDVERILGFPLPNSSKRHLPHWYGYEGSAVARAIRDAGWRARFVDLDARTVQFWENPDQTRMNPPPAPSPTQ